MWGLEPVLGRIGHKAAIQVRRGGRADILWEENLSVCVSVSRESMSERHLHE